MMWLFEQYGLTHKVISSVDFKNDLSDLYDVIVLPSGTTTNRIVDGLSPRRHDESWRWAYGVGPEGWQKLRQWVHDGGTLVALGSAVETSRELLDLPIEPALPLRRPRRPVATNLRRPVTEQAARPVGDESANPTRVAKPASIFYCPGSLLKQEHNPHHPIGFGMPERWPVFFRFDQAYNIRPSVDISADVVSRYPDEEDMIASGWVLGDEFLRNRANVVSFDVGKGTVVTMGSQIAFRTQPRATFKLLFNAIFHGPSIPVDATQLAQLK